MDIRPTPNYLATLSSTQLYPKFKEYTYDYVSTTIIYETISMIFTNFSFNVVYFLCDPSKIVFCKGYVLLRDGH
jgi:hypothetical protein